MPTGAARAGGHALGRSVDPGSRRGALAHRTRPAVAGAHRANRRPPSPASGSQGARRDRPTAQGSTSRPRSVGTGQHRRHRGVGHGGSARAGAGPVGAGALRRATRSTPRRSPWPAPGRFPIQLDRPVPGPDRGVARRASCNWRGRRPWTGPRWTPRTLAELAGPGTRGPARPPEEDPGRERDASGEGTHSAVPARAVARGGVRRPASRRADATPCRARLPAPPGTRQRDSDPRLSLLVDSRSTGRPRTTYLVPLPPRSAQGKRRRVSARPRASRIWNAP